MIAQVKPSKKLSVIGAILILLTGILIGGYLVLESNRGQAGELADILRGQQLTSCQPNPNDATADSDADGLKDWQESQIYNSDPCQADTDEDGFLDGEEAASGYDPAKKAPGDELPGTKPQTPRPLPVNLTESLRQRLSAQINEKGLTAGFSAEGQLVSPKELESFPGVSEAVWDIVQANDQLFAPDPLNDSDLKISDDNSLTAFNIYAKKLADCTCPTNNLSKNGAEEEAALFLKSLQKNDPALLDPGLKNYRAAYQLIKDLSVPSLFAQTHKEILNIVSSTIKVYVALQKFESDPLIASLALQQYGAIIDRSVSVAANAGQIYADTYLAPNKTDK
ncbi:MAG: thrombospondin type 3 repeat-containing protein [Patescibacteria group bacterium]